MRWLFVIALLLQLAAAYADSEETDPYWTALIRTELSLRTSGAEIQLSFTQKNLPKLGDCAAIALLKVLDEKAFSDEGQMKAALSIIRDAFSRSDLINVKSDRTPKITLLFLDTLARNTTNRELLQDIEETRTYAALHSSGK